jgi:hypothetical protein
MQPPSLGRLDCAALRATRFAINNTRPAPSRHIAVRAADCFLCEKKGRPVWGSNPRHFG